MNKIRYTKANHIKDVSYYQKAFAEIEKENFENISYENMKNFIEKDKEIPLLQMFQPHSDFNNRPFYRIRKLSDFKEDPSLVSSFGLPPIEFTKRGRANLPTHPVLYLSFLPQTPCIELNVLIGEEIFLSAWKFKNSGIGTLMYIGEPSYMDISWVDLINKENEILNKKLSYYNKDIIASIWYIKNKLSSWFLTDNKKVFSSFLGHYSLYDTDLSQYGYSLDCILYPSIADSYKASNLALSPKSKNKMEVTLVHKAILNGVTEQGINLTRTEVGKIIGEKINWIPCKK